MASDIGQFLKGTPVVPSPSHSLYPKGDSKDADGKVAVSANAFTPAKMSRPQIQPINSYAVAVSWVPPADFAAQRRALGAKERPHPELMGYQIRYGLIDTAFKTELLEQKWSANTTRAVLKHLEGGKKYFFQVAAFNVVGLGDWSDPSDVFHMPEPDQDDFGGKTATDRALDLTKSLKKKRPLLSSHASDAIDVSWEKPCDRGSNIVAYDILYSKNEDFEEFGTLRVDGSQSKARLTDLEPNTTYFFKHRAVNEVGCSNWSDTSPGISTISRVPDSPEAPRLQASKSFSLKIGWNHPKSYKIPVQTYRVRFSTKPSMDKAVEVPLPDDPASKDGMPVTSLRIDGLQPVTDYYFQVLAANQIGHSLWSRPSAPMRTQTSAPAQCEAPVYVDAVIDAITIAWPPPDSYGSRIDRYDVRMSGHVMMVNATEYSHIAYRQVGTMLQASLPNCFPPNTAHYFQVRASGTSTGYGAWSPQSDPLYTKPERPAAPMAPSKFRSLPRAIVANWMAPKDNGDPITEYRLRYDTSGDMRNCTECSGLEKKGCLTWHAITGLLPHTSYFFQVAAKNGFGWSDWSLPSRPVQVVQEAPAKPGAPYLQDSSRSEITVCFTIPADVGTLDGTTIHGYTLRYAADPSLLQPGQSVEDPTDNGKIKVINNANSPATVKNLLPGRVYYFQVHASNQFGGGEWSETSLPMWTHPSVPDAPEPAKQVERTAWSVVLQWKPPEDNGSKITKYLVRVLDEQMKGEPRDLHPIEHVEDDVQNGMAMQHYNADGLLPGTGYCFRVAAVNACGRSDWSQTTQPFKTEPTVPGAPGKPKQSGSGITFFEATWPLPRDNGSKITEYEVQYTDAFAATPTWDRNVGIIKTKETSVRVEGLTPGYTYFLRVSATNGIGVGPMSEIGRCRCDPSRPSTPIHPRVGEVGSSWAHLTWIPCYNGGEKLTSYKVSYHMVDEPHDEGEIPVPGFRRGIDVTSLLAGTKYVFRICAINRLGQSDWSEATKEIMTLSPLAPEKTGAPYFLKASPFSLEIAWMPALDNGAKILEQVIHYSRDPEFKNEKISPTKTITIVGLQNRRCSQLLPEEENVSGGANSDKDSGVAGLIHRMKKLKEQRKTIEDLEPGTTYYFTVYSVNCIGASPLSDVGEGCRTLPWKPLTIHSLDPTGLGAMWVSYNWFPPWDNGSPIHTYLFRYSRQKEHLIKAQEEEEAAGDSFVRVPRPPEENQDDENSYVQIDIPREILNAFLQGEYKEDHQKRETEVDQIDTSKHQWKIDDLEPGESYWASVQAINDIGASPWTMMGHSMKTNALQPTKMKVCHPVSCTESSVTFGWQAPLPRGSPISKYELCWVSRKYLSQDPWADVLLGDNTTLEFDPHDENVVAPESFTVKDLLPGTAVKCIARAINFVGTSEWNECMPEEIPEGFVTKSTPPCDPTVPRLVEGTLTAYTFSMVFTLGLPNGEPYSASHFKVAENAEMTQGVREWKAEMEDTPDTPWRQGMDYSFAVGTEHNLLPGTSYWAQVVVENAIGLSNWSPVSKEILTLPDCPKQPAPPYSDLTTPSTIEVKWFPPHDNGAPILGYAIRYYPPENGKAANATKSLTAAEVVQTPYIEIEEKEIGMEECLYELQDLLPGRKYYFSLRCRNRIGWSPWSSLSRGFVTKPTRPDAPDQVEMTEATPYRISVEWNKPAEHGAEITQYEVVCAQGVVQLKWLCLIAKVTARTVDIASLFGDAGEQSAIGVKKGAEDLGKIHMEGAFYACILPDNCSYSFEGLVPGRMYHVIVRAKNSAGKGNWSEPTGPLRTKSNVPGNCTKLVAISEENTSCSFAFSLPYDNGERIDQCVVKTIWLNGPTAEHEKVAGSRKPHPHIEQREDIIDPWTCPMVKDMLTMEEINAKRFEADQPIFTISNLLPGTDYEVSWCASNKLGRGIPARAVVVTTKAHIPDIPKAVMPHAYE